MPFPATRPRPIATSKSNSSPRSSSPAPVLDRSSSEDTRKDRRCIPTDNQFLAWGHLQPPWAATPVDFVVPTVSKPYGKQPQLNSEVAPKRDCQSAMSTMAFLERSDKGQLDLELSVQATDDWSMSLLGTEGSTFEIHPADAIDEPDFRTRVVQLADLLEDTIPTKNKKKPRRNAKDGDFEVIPHVRSVIALDDKAAPEPEIDEPWEHIYGADEDQLVHEPSYASIAALN